ncbi:MAG: hypothetical protein UU34_C0009G0009 [Candidatus Curtissbacteria bacterium GW2011_GWA1_41_11]|uniref:Uncharacterized protein n=1 Tax=Candidatus Curtissbacteria bacterium GW2011_GWA1_41_11 TaxID=1618409 RepID=A0A0G0UH52_9BACT|nr:MAG: hypothetical protein UU34_C0009G0009 [Candidatus Curtissbacteria bacterium GW2011_GWA1_41_11]
MSVRDAVVEQLKRVQEGYRGMVKVVPEKPKAEEIGRELVARAIDNRIFGHTDMRDASAHFTNTDVLVAMQSFEPAEDADQSEKDAYQKAKEKSRLALEALANQGVLNKVDLELEDERGERFYYSAKDEAKLAEIAAMQVASESKSA